jgi:hypothetical protein
MCFSISNQIVHPTINYEFDAECDLIITDGPQMEVNVTISNSFEIKRLPGAQALSI